MTSSQMSSITLSHQQVSVRDSKQSSEAGTIVTSDDHVSSRAELQDGDISHSDTVEMEHSGNDAGLHPLPMPEFGGWFAPLTEFLPETATPITNFHRCNLAMILITELVVDGLDLDCHSVDWSVHMPLMLHIIFLGMDNSRAIVHQHCKQLLLNLLVVLGCHKDHLSVAGVLLNNKTNQLDYGLIPQTERDVVHHNFLEEDDRFDSYLSIRIKPSDEEVEEEDEEEGDSVASEPSLPSMMSDRSHRTSQSVTFAPPTPDMPISEVLKALIQFIASRKNDGLLWPYEDTTKNLAVIKSSEQIATFLAHVLRVCEESVPHCHIAERWAINTIN